METSLPGVRGARLGLDSHGEDNEEAQTKTLIAGKLHALSSGGDMDRLRIGRRIEEVLPGGGAVTVGVS